MYCCIRMWIKCNFTRVWYQTKIPSTCPCAQKAQNTQTPWLQVVNARTLSWGSPTEWALTEGTWDSTSLSGKLTVLLALELCPSSCLRSTDQVLSLFTEVRESEFLLLWFVLRFSKWLLTLDPLNIPVWDIKIDSVFKNVGFVQPITQNAVC